MSADNGWRTLEGWELDREIKQQLGYRVEQRKNLFALVAPNGKCWINNGDERAAWESGPHYSTDANAALTLIEDGPEGNDYLLRKLNTGWHIHAYFGDSGKITATEPTIPLAICRAWLAWKDMQS